ncbi:sensor histidine kinase [Sphingomonas sp. ac-8]|uniref:sensor histidine kinase n=1 Tax=Sphingomonas sp. ac-8 TaxID=3242977 RepID=UPI003A7FFB68
MPIQRAPEGAAGRLIQRLPIAVDRPGLALACTLACVAAGFVVRWLADSLLPPGFPYVSFFPVVILTSFLFGVRMGTIAAVLCGLLAWYFFIPPYHTLTLTGGSTVALLFYVFVVATDIALVHWMQHANRNLARERELSRALADTRELLFNELQHRVSNNLQVAAGLLSVQKRQVSDAAARAALDEASRRLALIGRISRQLYDAGGATRKMREFLEPLCADVVEASGRTGIRCTINVAEDAPLSSDAAVPLALIVAEAMANAIEHGFRDRDAGHIEVHLARNGEDMVTVEVRDDGHGVPEGFSIEASDSLGLRIATMLAGQLNGSFDLIGGKGTIARLVLPA